MVRMTRPRKLAMVVGASALSLGVLSVAGPATGSHLPVRATAYVRADAGLATFNPDVNPGSNCATPDYDDVQTLSAPGTAANNVHVGADERVLSQVAIGWVPVR